MVMYGVASKKYIWFWLAVLWHTAIDAGAVYLAQNISMVALEGVMGVFAIISIGIVLWLQPRFPKLTTEMSEQIENTEPSAEVN